MSRGFIARHAGLALCAALVIVSLLVPVAPAAPAPQTGGRLITVQPSDPTGMDPRLHRGVAEENIQDLLFNTLVGLNEQYRLEPELAVEWQVGGNGRIFTFKLRRGVKFHNGQELTAADVKHTFDFIRDPQNGSPYASDVRELIAVDAVDRYTVRFVLSSPYADFLEVVVARRGIVPKEHAERVGPGGFNDRPVGTGPFVFVERRRRDRIVVRRNPNYWKAGLPSLDELVVRMIPEESVRVISIETGEIDHLYRYMPMDDFERLRKTEKFHGWRTPEPALNMVMLNMEHPILKNPLLRQAIAHAVDKQAMIKAYGNGTVSDSGLLSTHWAYERGLKKYPYDLKRAAELYRQAGSPPMGGVELLGLADIAGYKDMAILLHDNLKRAGINVRLNLQERPVAAPRYQRSDFHIYVGGINDIWNADISLYRFHSAAGQNFSRYRRPEVDKLLEETRRSTDPNERAAAYRRVQRYLNDDLPWIYLHYREHVALIKKTFTGYTLLSTRIYRAFERTQVSR